VLEWLVEDEPGARIAGFDVPEFRRYLERDARDWRRPREQVFGGRPWREVLRAAEEARADLVVMGVRGRNPVDLAVFGSTTQHVVRGARCPVLVVHTD
jgi:nucleotide-binding universal stress UspA family protein